MASTLLADISGEYLASLSQARSDEMKRRREIEHFDERAVIELHDHA